MREVDRERGAIVGERKKDRSEMREKKLKE